MTRRGSLREYVGGALWVMPTAAVIASLVAGAVLAQIDTDADSGIGRVLFQGDAGAARELLIVVSATMITVTGLVFSLTVVALQISSTQFSPRLLRTFLRDRGTQVVLSIFVSTFAYATAGLYTVGRLEDGQPYVPRVAISGSLLLALCSVAAFVWYLHHLAHSIQIDDVMRRHPATVRTFLVSEKDGTHVYLCHRRRTEERAEEYRTITGSSLCLTRRTRRSFDALWRRSSALTRRFHLHRIRLRL